MIVYRSFRVHASRHLPKLDNSHICKNMHGHTFNITIYVQGEINKKDGFVHLWMGKNQRSKSTRIFQTAHRMILLEKRVKV